MSSQDQEFVLEMDSSVLAKFEEILSAGSMVHAASSAHQANNINNGFEDLSQG